MARPKKITVIPEATDEVEIVAPIEAPEVIEPEIQDGEDKAEEVEPPTDIPEAEAHKEVKHIVIQTFRDKHNFDKKWQPGDDVSHFDADRLQHLVNTEHVEVK